MRFFKQLFYVLIILNCSALFADQFEPFSENGKVGLRNTTTNTVIIPASFESMGWSDKSFSIVNGVTGALQNEKWALIDTEGHKVTDHYFNSLIPSTQNNFIASRRENNTILTHYGVIDSKGKTIVEFEYGLISPHAGGLIVSKKKSGKYLRGFVSEKGQVIIPAEYQQVVSLNEKHLAVSDTKNQFAIYDTEGNSLTDFAYEYIRPYREAYYLVGQYNHQGLLSTNMELIIPPLYKDLQFYDHQIIATSYTQWDLHEGDTYQATFYFDDINFLEDRKLSNSADGKTGIVTWQNEYLSFLEDESIEQSNEHVVVTRNSLGRLKVYDSKGSSLFRDSFEEVQLYNQVLFAKNNQADGHSWAAYNFQGKKINLSNYQSFQKISDTFFEAKRNDKIGLIGSNGKEVSPFLYDELSEFENDCAIALYNNGYGLINTNGLWIMTPYYDSLFISEDHVYFRQGSENGIADLFGKVIYRDQQPFETKAGSIIKTQEDSSKAIYSFSGERLLEHDYDSVKAIGKELLILYRDEQAFFYRPSDGHDLKLEGDIELVEQMHNGFIPVLKGGQWGFLDENGRITIANRYEEVGTYSEGLFSVKLIGKWGFVNEMEELVIQPNYDHVSPFKHGLSVVQNQNLWGIINNKGESLISLFYDRIDRLGDYFLIHSNNQVGLADSEGHIIKNPSFDSIWPLSDGYFLVGRNGLFGVINHEGHDVLPTVYESIKQSGNLFLGSKPGEERVYKLK